MFTHLWPLLAQRALVMTVAKVDDTQIRVNIVPRLTKREEDNRTESKFLMAPLTITGTPEEIDAQLPSTLATYATSLVQAGNSLEEVQTQLAAGLKIADADAATRLAEKKKGKSVTPPKVDPKKLAEKVAAATPAPKPEKPAVPSLFDLPVEATPVVAPLEAVRNGVREALGNAAASTITTAASLETGSGGPIDGDPFFDGTEEEEPEHDEFDDELFNADALRGVTA